MIHSFTEAWNSHNHLVRESFITAPPTTYCDIVKVVVSMLAEVLPDYDAPDPERIHPIDDGDYQGTLVYVVGAKGYQPSRYWYVKIAYGSCSVCDTLQSIQELYDETQRVNDYMTLALHVIQGLREMNDD